MVSVVELRAPGQVALGQEEPPPLVPGSVRVRTAYSGISAGTELTAFRGSNPYLTRHWDAERRLFTDGEPTFRYPVTGWGYQEVGTVTEVAADVTTLAPGDRVYGIWGHRSEAVVPAHLVHPLPEGVTPVHGVFARVGAIALNAVLAAQVALGDIVAVLGQGVIGLLATRLATLSGADVVAVDAVPGRRALARDLGAIQVLDVGPPGAAATAVRELTGGHGADSAIELSGSYAGLAEAIRTVAPDATVVAAGFYQGQANGLRLGEEFHHNRVRIVASQIGGTPPGVAGRWDHARLNRTVIMLMARGSLDVEPLLSHVLPAAEVSEAFALLDRGAPDVLQVVLDFRSEP